MDAVQPIERRKLRIAARALAERRRWRRVALPSPARIMLETGRELPCEIIDVSAGGVRLRATARPAIGSRIVLMSAILGRLDVDTLSVGDDEISGTLHITARKRDRLADTLTWLSNKTELGLEEDRIAPRLSRSEPVSIVFADGVRAKAQLIDVSKTGVSLATRERPNVGERLTLQGRPAVVTRIHGRGFAVRFDSGQEGEL